MPILNYYEILQVSPDADAEVVQGAYRALVRKFHPDAHRPEASNERMKIINEAYEVLSDPERRRQYDQRRGAERQGRQPPSGSTSDANTGAEAARRARQAAEERRRREDEELKRREAERKAAEAAEQARRAAEESRIREAEERKRRAAQRAAEEERRRRDAEEQQREAERIADEEPRRRQAEDFARQRAEQPLQAEVARRKAGPIVVRTLIVSGALAVLILAIMSFADSIRPSDSNRKAKSTALQGQSLMAKASTEPFGRPSLSGATTTSTPPETAPGPASNAREYPEDQIAFCGSTPEGSGLHVLNADGTGLHRIIASPRCLGRPVWSPDGALVAFPGGESGNSRHIYLAAPDGSQIRRVTSEPGNQGGVNWSPDGRQLAFYRDFSSDDQNVYHDSQIYILTLADNSITVVSTPKEASASPSWSPDGRSLAFSFWTGEGYEIRIMNSDGSSKRPLIPGEYLVFDEEPAWAPDGSIIAFRSNRDGNALSADVYVAKADGTDIRRLTRYVADDWGPAWSPDGSYLAFLSERDGTQEIYTMRRDGSSQLNVTRGCCESVGYPSWTHKKR